MVRCISLEETLDLRNRMLRNNVGIDHARFIEDAFSGVFHVGYEKEENIVCVATFIPVNHPKYQANGYQLRGMATDVNHSGKGLGSAVMDFAFDKLRSQRVQYLWCNARKSATPFYEKLGFYIISDEFIVEGIGPHYQMYYNLKS